MKKIRKRLHELKGFVFVLFLAVSFALLGGGFWLYQKNIEKAVYSTTVSFMGQIADHDQMNVANQMNNKWEYLNSMLERIRVTRESRLEDIVYTLNVEAEATAFEKLYLVTEDERVYSSAYLENTLTDMPWKDKFQQTHGNFVTRYSQNSREQWGEYLIYGVHLKVPVSCLEDEIAGIVGLVPISEIASQMRLESFDGQGVAVVIQPSGEIITASQQYSSNADTQNFLASLEDARFSNGGSLESCRQAIEQGESLFVRYNLDGQGFYALFQPMKHQGGTGWYLVVRVSEQVTANEARTLVLRSLPFFGILALIMVIVTYYVYRSLNDAQIARASEKAKSSFLANMSHEIRTPLNGIVGLQYLMRQNLNNPEKLEEYLKKAEISAEFLKGIITDVLDMSKIESGQLELYCSSMDLSKMVGALEVLVGTQAEDKGIRFHTDCSAMSWPAVQGDELRVKQVLANLLANSLKFTPGGGEISLTVSQELSGGMVLTTFVAADTGCGMSEEFLERIWLPFEQEKRIASQNGTGLGTTLSKTLVEKMGGTISVKSKPGDGTVFTVSIPFRPVQQSVVQTELPEPEEKEGVFRGKNILVVEDNEINRMIVVSILREYGCSLTEAADGQAAVDAFENSSEGFFNLILMDIQMPVMDGYEATRTIRALSRRDGCTVPIFAMTANAFRDDIDKAIKSGMNDVVTKPLDITLLLEKIKKL